MWLTAGPEADHLAVVTQTGPAAPVTESAGQIWAELARRYGPPLVPLEHHPAPEAGDGAETLDLVRLGAAAADNDAAVAVYQLSVKADNPLSERNLARMVGRTSCRWAHVRIAYARQAP